MVLRDGHDEAAAASFQAVVFIFAGASGLTSNTFLEAQTAHTHKAEEESQEIFSRNQLFTNQKKKSYENEKYE